MTELASEDAARHLAGLKKQAMAEAAEKLLAGTGWLPVYLRTSQVRQANVAETLAVAAAKLSGGLPAALSLARRLTLARSLLFPRKGWGKHMKPDKKPTIPFRHSAGFGSRMEYWIIGRMLKEGLDVYVPMVDDFGIDAVIRKADNQFIEVQIKARSSAVKLKDAALFAAIVHPEVRANYYFVFYSERLETTWIMSSEEFVQEAVRNKSGKNVGKRSIWFNGTKRDHATGLATEYAKQRYDKYRDERFDRFKAVTKLVATPAPEPPEQ